MKNIVYFILTAVLLLAPFNKSFASDISSRLRGRIILQVESRGEAWYVNPDNEKRYFLGRPADAFQVMRELGLGISNKDFNSFNEIAPNRLSGKILLKVEDSGKAYYINPVNLKMYFLGSPADAFNVMRSLGLGITNKDLETIPTFQKTMIVKVFFPNSVMDPGFLDCNVVRPTSRVISYTLATGEASLKELIKGPTAEETSQGFQTSVDSNTIIKSLSIKDGIAYVDFDKSLQNKNVGLCAGQFIQAQIRQTLLQFSTVKSVVISIDGDKDFVQP